MMCQEGNIFDDQGNTLPELQREVFDFSSATGSGIRIYVTYTGKPISLRVSNCSLGPQLKVTGTTRGLEYVYNDDGTTTITATNVGNYMFRVRLNQYNVYDWQGGLVGSSSSYDRAVYLMIMPKEIDVPTLVANDDFDTGETAIWEKNRKTVTYNTANRYISTVGYLSNYMNVSHANLTKYTPTAASRSASRAGEDGGGDESGDNSGSEGGDDGEGPAADPTLMSFYAVNQGLYTITFSLVNTSNYVWKTGNTSNISIEFYIKPKPVAVPKIEDGTSDTLMEKVYNGSPYYMTIGPWNQNEISVTSKTTTLSQDSETPNKYYATNYGDYAITLNVANSNYVWADSQNSSRTYTLRITQRSEERRVGKECRL